MSGREVAMSNELKIMITLVIYATARAVRVSRVSAFAAVA